MNKQLAHILPLEPQSCLKNQTFERLELNHVFSTIFTELTPTWSIGLLEANIHLRYLMRGMQNQDIVRQEFKHKRIGTQKIVDMCIPTDRRMTNESEPQQCYTILLN